MYAFADFGDWADRQPLFFESNGLSGDFKQSGAQEQNDPADTRKDFKNSRERGDKENIELLPFDMLGFGVYGDGKKASTCKARDYKDATDLITYPIQDQATRFKGGSGRGKGNGLGVGDAGAPSFTLTSSDKHAVCVKNNELALVRRLTPLECERLQGMPDNHTRIPWRGKTEEECPDGLRYQAIGNSMAVPVMRWIGNRIKQI